MNIFFRLLLTLNATFLFVIVFLVKEQIVMADFNQEYYFDLSVIPEVISYIAYIFVLVFCTACSIYFTRFLGCDEFKVGEIVSIDHASLSFLPSYLGYFFVALSINDLTVFWFVYVLIFIFTYLSQALYFNPIFFLFGYKFYNLKTKKGTAILLISKASYKVPTEIVISEAYRINDYTFIER